MATTTSVTLRVYDLSRGMARQFSPSLLGKQIDGIWHTGVLVFGKEYFFGGGIQAVAPEIVVARYGMQPVQQVPLGETSVTRAEFEAFLRSINHRFTAATYDLLRNNCNNFSNEVALFLVGHGIPEHIINLPNEALSTPLGAMFRPMVENLQREMNATGAQPFGNPFNDVSLAVSPAISSDNAATTANQPALLSRTFTVSSDPTLRLETVVRRIESLNYQQKTLLDGEEIAALKAFTTTVVQLQTQLKSSPSPSSDAPTKVVRQLWSILVKLLQEGALSPFFFPALAVFRVLLLLPTSDADVLVLKTAAFDHLLAVTEAEDIKLTQAQTVLLLTVLVNGFANPAASELVLARALQFLPFVFRSIIETGAHSHDVRIMSAKLIGNCCLAMQVEEELLIMVIIGGCIEVLDRLSREGGATPAATHHIQLTLEGVVVGVGRLLQSFAAARNLSVELGLPEVLQRLHSSPSLFRIRPLLSEVVALI